MGVYPMLERLNRLTESVLDIRSYDDDHVEYHVALQPTVHQEIGDCGHPVNVTDMAVVLYIHLFRDGALLSGHAVMPREDIYIDDDEGYVRWVDRLWDSLVVKGIETFIEDDSFGSGHDH